MIQNGYGYVGSYKPPQMQKINTGGLGLAASAAPTAANPFGFRTARQTSGFNEQFAAAGGAAKPKPPPHITNIVNPVSAQQAAKPLPTPGGYRLDTDPALQQITALTGMSDEQAQAAALKQQQQQILGYGDPNVARRVLGDESLAQAAAGNPTSTLHQLDTQHDRNLHDLTEGLNQQNLLYSGYRVTQEQQDAQDFQNMLAQAAAGLNSNLDTIGGNLTGTLTGNAQQRAQAKQQAADRAVQAALARGGVLSGYDANGDPLFDYPAAQADTGLAAAAAGGGGGGGGGPTLPLLSGSFDLASPATRAPLLSGGGFTLADLMAPTQPAYGNAHQRRKQAL
jgi:hypothetical protein